MMPYTVPKSPTKGVVAPMVPRIQRFFFIRRPSCARSRSTAASTPGVTVRLRSSRSNATRYTSARGVSVRSTVPFAAEMSPRSRCRPTASVRARELAVMFHSAIHRSTATPMESTDAARMKASVAPPRRR